MIFYATFFVGYSALAVARCYVNTPANRIPQVKMFCLGSLAVVIFAFGYLLGYPVFMIIGSLLPSTLTMGVLKGVVFAAIIALVGCMRGFQSSSDAQGVGRATTSAVVTSIFLVVVADAILTRLYTMWGY